MKRILLFPITVILLSSWVQGGRIPLVLDHDVEGVEYSDAIPTPEATLGHVIGSRHTLPHQVVDYFREVAGQSDRVLLREHGRTYENRPLIHAVVSSPENLERLESIRSANLRLSDTPSGVSDQEIASMPAIVYLGFSIHGNEASGTEASMLLLYHLAAGYGPSVDSILENMVVLIDPSLNPDGRSRFAEWVNANRGAVATTDLQDREHNEPWPGGRTNHYWFDLNRDWLPARHPESQGRVELFHHWRPQYLADFHEMGRESTFFFQPGVPARTNPDTPARNQELTEKLAEFHVRKLDRIGSLYYARETFDDFYYGKGSTYPDLNGSVGILFEQASSRSLRTTTASGELTYPFTIRNQFVAALSSLEGVHSLRRDFLTYQRDFYGDAESVFEENLEKAYLLDVAGSPYRTRLLAELMQLHRIRVHHLSRDIEVDGYLYREGRDLIIPLNQPQIRLIKTMMERVTEFNDSIFYDVSAWTLPLAFGIRYASLDDDGSLPVGAEWSASAMDVGGARGTPADYAYLLPWDHYMAPAALYQLQKEGINCRLLQKQLLTRTGETEREFDPGTLIIPVAQPELEREDVHSAVQKAAQEYGVVFYGVNSGWTEEGPSLGSPSSRFLQKPTIALVAGPGTSAYQVGETWYILSETMKIPVSLIDSTSLDSVKLDDYNTLIVTGGSHQPWPKNFPGRVKRWVSRGGALIGIQGGSRWIVEKEIIDETLNEEQDSIPADTAYAEVESLRGAQVVGGSIFQVELDTTHPVAYGAEPTIAVFRDHNTFFELSKEPGSNTAAYSKEPLLGGYISDDNLKILGESAAVIARKSGQGAVILFVDNPNFRAFWYGTSRLFLNSVFFGRSF